MRYEVENIKCKRASRLLVMLYNDWKTYENDNRPLKIEWNMMHMFSSSQIAKIYALKNNLDPELCAIIAIFHDIAVVEGKIRENHDLLAEPYIIEAVRRFNNEYRKDLDMITEKELALILEAAAVHSDKEHFTDNGYIEMMKNVDCLDRYLYGIKSDGANAKRVSRMLNDLSIKL